MKKSKFFAIASLAMAITSCGGNTSDQNETKSPELDVVTMSRAELESTLQTQDTLLSLVNDISADMVQIKEMERIISTPANLNGETPSQKQQLKNDIVAIKDALAQRRDKLNELENKLKNSAGQNAKLLKTIENLKVQIAEHESTIQTLTTQLAEANTKINDLSVAVDSLNTSVATEKADKEQAIQQADNLTAELNKCYYAIGTKNELEKNNIIKTGFLRKTKIMQGDFEMSYFTTIDKRKVTTLPLHAKKAKVMTNQPQSTYRIVDGQNGEKILEITNPARFWETSNFLVIQVD